ncbi:MAG: hypothetical protein HY790_03310 [Deltaproteobacteria bacterium]|nr:hypothetical protein [Deltaproteobacteria bacterium]MBI4794861.1 hypothetical protein [Deltaproteobacteria bacterium]
MIKRFLFFGAYLLFCLACFLLVFELIYRYQLIDFFRPELKANNSAADLRDSHRKTLMAMGDSFSAGSNTWVAFLRPKFPSYRIISAALSATGIFESLYSAPRRFREFRPQVFIYQVYVGNDLQDIRRPLNRQTMTLPRYTYGFLCSFLGLRSLTFANYRLAQLHLNFMPRKVQAKAPQFVDTPFSPATYPLSVRIYTQAQPSDLEDTVLARGERGRDLATLVDGIKKLVSYAGPECRKYVVVVPDAGQVSDFYLDHLKQLGAQVNDPQGLHRDDYPFFVKLQEGLADQEIKVLNPLPRFKENERQGRRLYYNNDSHLKPIGQSLLGEFILEQLIADGLPPK